MNIISYRKGRTEKTVVIGRLGNATKDEIVAVAMAAANEDKSSLFGWDCYITKGFSSDDDFAIVHLWTD